MAPPDSGRHGEMPYRVFSSFRTTFALRRFAFGTQAIQLRLRPSHIRDDQIVDRGAALSFQPKNAAPYVDRNCIDAGLLHAGDPAVRVFTDRGWRWGGYWRIPIDYQHFER
jgi:hypothetical protein